MERKYFLDWLRVLAFGTLVLFHVGMLYVTWGYNLKSPRIYPNLEWLMEVMSPWRMPLLFVISGVACRFLIMKVGPRSFALNRLARLGVVILTGMLLVNPLQVWVQLLSQGDTSQGYLEFWWSSYLASDSVYFEALGRPMPTWDHLWFIVYLLPYTLLFAAIAALLRDRSFDFRPPLWTMLVLPAVWMAATNVIMATAAPLTHALINDWGAHLKWLGLFAIGTVVANRADFWVALRTHRRTLGMLTAALLTVYLMCRMPLRGRSDLTWTFAYRSAQGAFGWAAVLFIGGYASRYLNRSSALLRYLNDAVLPVYVLHQPILLASGFVLFPLSLPISVEVGVLLAATGLGSWLIYHVAIRRWRVTRVLFGLKLPTYAQGVL